MDLNLDSVECALSYPVLVGKDARLALDRLAAPFDRVVCLIDENVSRLHQENLGGLQDLPSLVLAPGEAQKSWQGLNQVCEFLADSGCGRGSLLVTVGGGVVSDLGGLAASVFKRGMAVGHMPTTLLAQVDASIGGKTAINLPQGKNLVGSFHAPQFVLADPLFLTTLPQEEWLSGLGEVVKTALLARKPLWENLRQLAPKLGGASQATDGDFEPILRACIKTKAQWVQSDPTEQGSRKALNLGHTFAHAIEHAAGYGQVPHGVAVGMGLMLALEVSRETDRLIHPELPGQVRSVLEELSIPARWADWPASKQVPISYPALEQGLRQDKKGAVGQPRFVLPLELGRVVWDVDVANAVIERAWNAG